MNGCGTFGAEGIPIDFVNSTDSFRSIICDYDLNGWDVVSPPFFGDLITAAFYEGFYFQRGAGASNYSSLNRDYTCTDNDIPGELTNFFNYGDSISIIWESDFGNTQITQTKTLYENKKYIINNVTLINTSSKPNQDIFYVRDVLPSPELYISEDYRSVVAIVANYIDDNYSLITSTGLGYNSYFAIVSNSPRAFCGFYLPWLSLTGDTDFELFNNSMNYFDSGSDSGYIAMNLGFKQPQLMKDESVTFSFAYIFSPDEVDQALAKTNNPVVYENCIYPPIEIFNVFIGAIELSSEYGAGMEYELAYKLPGTGTYTFVEATDYEELNWLVGFLVPCTEYDFRLSAIGELDTCITEIYNTKTQCPNYIALTNNSI